MRKLRLREIKQPVQGDSGTQACLIPKPTVITTACKFWERPVPRWTDDTKAMPQKQHWEQSCMQGSGGAQRSKLLGEWWYVGYWHPRRQDSSHCPGKPWSSPFLFRVSTKPMILEEAEGGPFWVCHSSSFTIGWVEAGIYWAQQHLLLL